MTDLSWFNAVIARLDADIAVAEQQLEALRTKRLGALSFLEYLNDATDPASGQPQIAAQTLQMVHNSAVGPWRAVEAVLDKSGAEQTVDVITAAVHESGRADLDRAQIRGGLHYLRKKGLVENGSGRGRWRWKTPENSEAPVSAGASGSEESTSDSSSEERSSNDMELQGDHDRQVDA